MVDKERRLGRGLDSLISAARADQLDASAVKASGRRIEAIRVELIDANPYQPRKEFNLEALNELTESLRHHGLMQPVVIRRCGPRYQLVAGERRLRAATELGWSTIDAVVVEVDEKTMLEWALIENIQRQQLGPLEIADSLRSLADSYSLSQSEVARAVGMSRPAVANLLRLLDLPESVREHVSRGTLAMSAARAVLSVEGEAEQVALAEAIVKNGWNVRQVEEEVRRRSSSQGGSVESTEIAPAPGVGRNPDTVELESQLEMALGLPVEIKGSGRKGKVVLRYDSAEALADLIRRLEALKSREEPDEGGGEEAAQRITV